MLDPDRFLALSVTLHASGKNRPEAPNSAKHENIVSQASLFRKELNCMTESNGLAPFTIALHPVHDAEHHHIADRLFLKEPHNDPVEHLMSSTARALASAVYELGDSGLLGERTLFVDLPLEWLDRPEL